ncbi:MAG: VWA domain-containing protein [Planctomycetes bacterium]|nr:VWA domain-containing protein [Planctomycetota bacterium]
METARPLMRGTGFEIVAQKPNVGPAPMVAAQGAYHAEKMRVAGGAGTTLSFDVHGNAAAAAPVNLAVDAGRIHTITTGKDVAGRYPIEAGDGVLSFEEGAPPADREQYAHVQENPWLRVADQPLSTLSIDVDTASYANVRRILNEGRLPEPGAVRIEEMLNYFRYAYAEPTGEHPFSVTLEVGAAPWRPAHRLVRIGLKAREVPEGARPASNLVFLLDVSGSMHSPDKLPLVQQSLRMLVDRLTGRDRVAICVYAGAAGLVLPSTPCSEKGAILEAIGRLQAGGSTAGAEGIELAYEVAQANFIDGGTNRVLLCTDGDFNVGVSSESGLVSLIEDKRKGGVFLSVLGFGTGNYADQRMEELSNHGNGNAAYIDSLQEARKVLVEEAGGTLITVAKDVKIQVEFNPARVAAYRLVGYENRLLAAQDFNDDTKDAGEMGAGHTVTALYEVVPAGVEVPGASVDPLKYSAPAAAPAEGTSGELLTVKLRYKQPEGDTSTKLEVPLVDRGDAARPSADFDFAASVAGFGMLLRGSTDLGPAGWGLVEELALSGLSDDRGGYRAEYLNLVREAARLSGGK